MGLRAGWGLEMEPEVAASSCFSGVWGLLSHLALGPLELTSSCLPERGFKVHSGKPRPADGQGSRHHPGLAGFPWAPGPGREPGLCLLPARGAQADWCWAHGSDLQPLALLPRRRFWVTGASRAGPGEGLRLDVGMRHCHPRIPDREDGSWEQRLQ